MVSNRPRVTLTEVAARAGVGTATVDRVINERGSVKEDVRRRVLEAARELGLKRILPVSHHSMVRINVILARPELPLIGRMALEFGRNAQRLDRSVVLHRTVLDNEEPATIAETLRKSQHDANIVYAQDHPLIRAAIAELAGRGKPVVTIISDLPGSSRLAYAGTDHYKTGRSAGYFLGRMCQAGDGTATVDRVLNGRPGVKDKTRSKVLAALEELGRATGAGPQAPHKIAFIVDSGASFNQTLRDAVDRYAPSNARVAIAFTAMTTSTVKPSQLAQLIEKTSQGVAGMVIVCRDDVIIGRAIRSAVERGVAVVCITTDIPGSNRLAYIGSDQASAGATAAYLMGSALRGTAGKILLVFSAPYRSQAEREMGFRSVLRSEFPHLELVERVNSNDDSEYSYRNVRKYIEEHGAPAGIYNVAAGNVGIAQALKDEGLKGRVVFIGHELTTNTRMLLETDAMNFAIGHDIGSEVSESIASLEDAFLGGNDRSISPSPIRVYTKYNCL